MGSLLVVAFWTLPFACVIRYEMKVVHKELKRDRVKSKVAKSEFDR